MSHDKQMTYTDWTSAKSQSSRELKHLQADSTTTTAPGWKHSWVE